MSGDMYGRVGWPNGKRFAFTIFDDTDWTTVGRGPDVYSLLTNLGMRTTKSVWVLPGHEGAEIGGQTCHDPEYLAWVYELQKNGFEIAFHNATNQSTPREAVIHALGNFRHLFGHYPRVHVNHMTNRDNLYWGPSRLSGSHRLLYRLLTRNRTAGLDGGTDPRSEYFWGDVAKRHISYVRNFVFNDINTLKQCPVMPYHDPDRPYVNYWFASSDGGTCERFCRTLDESSQDRLEEEGGACIIYTHFGVADFRDQRGLNSRFVELLERLAAKDGWFVPVGELLDHLRAQRSEHEITPALRARLERKWLMEKALVARGSS